jgi:hypothetical protein
LGSVTAVFSSGMKRVLYFAAKLVRNAFRSLEPGVAPPPFRSQKTLAHGSVP